MIFKSEITYNQLPEGYDEVRLYDVKDKSFRIITGPDHFMKIFSPIFRSPFSVFKL